MLKVKGKVKTSGLFWVWVALIVIAIDRLTKVWVAGSLMLSEPLRVTPILNFTLAYNKGAAFSFLHAASGWQNIFFSSLAVIVSAVIVVWLYRITRREWWTSIALSFILGGAVGNAWDRLSYGYVIDFIHFHMGDWNFAIFNVADSAISVGAVMLLVSMIWGKK